MDFDEFSKGSETFSHQDRIQKRLIPTTPTIKTLEKLNELDYSRTFSERGFLSTRNLSSSTCGEVISWANFTTTKKDVSLDEKRKKTLLDLKILSNLLNYLDCGDILSIRDIICEFREKGRHKKLIKERLFSTIVKGLNVNMQYRFWKTIVGLKNIKKRFPLTFSSQLDKACPYLKDITKDIDRTFPEHAMFSTKEGKDSLLKVLVAVANSMENVGYVQGLNSVAGIFLLHLKEEESFWTIIYMLKKLKLEDFFAHDFYKVHILNYQLEIFLEYYLPEVANFFKRTDVEKISYFTTPWFITFFSDVLSFSKVIKAWNLLFLKGEGFLIQVALALFSLIKGKSLISFSALNPKEKLFNLNVDELGQFFKYEIQELIEQDTSSLFIDTLSFSIPKRILRQMEQHYKQGKPNLKLHLNFENKLELNQIDPIFSGRKRNTISDLFRNQNQNSKGQHERKVSCFHPSHIEAKEQSFKEAFSQFKSSFKDTLSSISPKESKRDDNSTLRLSRYYSSSPLAKVETTSISHSGQIQKYHSTVKFRSSFSFSETIGREKTS